MATPEQDVTEAELAVLDALWDSGPSAIRALTEALYPGGSASEYATVQKLLERLEAKGWVSRKRGPGPHVFRPRHDRSALIDHRLQATADQLCGGSFAGLLSCLVSGKRLSKAERQRLRSLIDSCDRGGGRRRS